MTPYRERSITFLGPRHVGGRVLKEYAIAATGELPRDEVLAAGRRAVERLLTDRTPPGAPAFSIAHEGEDACYHLAFWWVEGCVLHGAVETAPLDAPASTSPLATHTVACTWELVPVTHERDAWVRHVLSADGSPDHEAWATDGWSGRA